MTATAWIALAAAAFVVIGAAALWRREAGRWVEFHGAVGHRPRELARVLAALRSANVRHRTRNAVALGTETASGAGMSTTVLVHRDDVARARRVVREGARRSGAPAR